LPQLYDYFDDVLSLEKEQEYDNKYVLQLTNQIVNINKSNSKLWTLGSHLFLLVTKDSKQYIINFSLRYSKSIELTEGLNEILFNNGTDRSIIKPSDIKTWSYLIDKANMRNYKNSKYWLSLNPIHTPSTLRIEEFLMIIFLKRILLIKKILMKNKNPNLRLLFLKCLQRKEKGLLP
jgi:hypothetical protein